MKGAGMTHGFGALYGLRHRHTASDSLALGAARLGQNCPRHCPQSGSPEIPFAPSDPLGAPLSIREVAALIGVSVWTVRQRFLPAGLPHSRATPQGKLLFYKHQIITWLLQEQRKGGTIT